MEGGKEATRGIFGSSCEGLAEFRWKGGWGGREMESIKWVGALMKKDIRASLSQGTSCDPCHPSRLDISNLLGEPGT